MRGWSPRVAGRSLVLLLVARCGEGMRGWWPRVAGMFCAPRLLRFAVRVWSSRALGVALLFWFAVRVRSSRALGRALRDFVELTRVGDGTAVVRCFQNVELVTSCHVMSCHVMSRVMSRHIIISSRDVMSCYVVSCLRCLVVSCRVVSRHVVSRIHRMHGICKWPNYGLLQRLHLFYGKNSSI